MQRLAGKTAGFAAILLGLGTAPAGAQDSTTTPMAFEQCLQVIASTAAQTGLTPISVVDTNDLRVVRFAVDDGSLLITCSRAAGTMVTAAKPNGK